MLYLIQSVYKDDNDNYHDILKIGFTNNLEKRLSHYTSHNFGFKLLKTREGDEELEKLLHYHFNKYLIKESYNREWFEYNEEIINNFSILEKEELSYLNKKNNKNQGEKITDDLLLELCENDLDLFSEIRTFLNDFNINRNFKRRIKSYCIFLSKNNYLDLLKKIPEIPNTFHMYYELLGHDGIRAYSYEELPLRNEVEIKLKVPEIRTAILFNFQPGNKYSRGYIKEKLQEIYDQLGLKKKAKANDLDEYFITKRSQFRENGKKIEGFEIIQLK